MKNFSEVSLNKYAYFSSMNELVSAMGKNVKVWSWAARGYSNHGNTFLRFKVNGHLFKGWVYIGVNSKDLFDVYLTNHRKDIIHTIQDVYVEDLIDAIDKKVERVPNYKW